MTPRDRHYSHRIIAGALPAVVLVFLSLPAPRKSHAAAGGSIQPGISVIDSGRNVRRAQGRDLDEASVRRWAELFANILGEFRVDGRDPVGRVQGDYASRTVRIIGTDDDRDVGVTRTLSARQLETADLKALASRLYAQARKAAEQR